MMMLNYEYRQRCLQCSVTVGMSSDGISPVAVNGFPRCRELTYWKYCKTLYFSCILIWRFCSVEISLHFNLVFCRGVLYKVKFHVTSHMN